MVGVLSTESVFIKEIKNSKTARIVQPRVRSCFHSHCFVLVSTPDKPLVILLTILLAPTDSLRCHLFLLIIHSPSTQLLPHTLCILYFIEESPKAKKNLRVRAKTKCSGLSPEDIKVKVILNITHLP